MSWCYAGSTSPPLKTSTSWSGWAWRRANIMAITVNTFHKASSTCGKKWTVRSTVCWSWMCPWRTGATIPVKYRKYGSKETSGGPRQMEQGAWNYEVTWGFINVLNDVQYTIISLLVYDFLRLLLSEIKHFFHYMEAFAFFRWWCSHLGVADCFSMLANLSPKHGLLQTLLRFFSVNTIRALLVLQNLKE